MLRSKRREVVRSYISRLVTEAQEAGAIRINVATTDDDADSEESEEEAS